MLFIDNSPYIGYNFCGFLFTKIDERNLGNEKENLNGNLINDNGGCNNKRLWLD